MIRPCLNCKNHDPIRRLSQVPPSCWTCASSDGLPGFIHKDSPMPEDNPIERRIPADSIKPHSKGQLLKGPASSTQVGGGHYKDLKIQPDEYIHGNKIGFHEGCAIKYLTRWRAKGGLQDLQKAKHFIDLLVEREGLLPESLGESRGSWVQQELPLA